MTETNAGWASGSEVIWVRRCSHLSISPVAGRDELKSLDSQDWVMDEWLRSTNTPTLGSLWAIW
jgi:hypothetical protein